MYSKTSLATNQPPPEPGTLRLKKGVPNPNGVRHADLFLLSGDATTGPVYRIVPDNGVTLPARRGDLTEKPFLLRILHINDLHSHILRFNAYGYWPVFSRIVWRIRTLRLHRCNKPGAAVLALSAGDDLIGSVFDELLGEDSESYQLNAAYRLYSAAGFDAGTFGNHDLDLGTRLIARSIQRDAKFPLLSANLIGAQCLNGFYHPAALWVIKGVRVGIIGVTTPATLARHGHSDLQLVNPLQVVHNILPALQPWCDVIIILSHLGYSLDGSPALVSHAGDVELARSLPPGSVHLIVGGHTHHVLNEQGLAAHNIVNHIPIVQAGSFGRFLGEVDIVVQQRATVTNARLTPTSDLPVDESFERTEVKPILSLTEPLLKRRLGTVIDDPDLNTDVVLGWFASGESALVNFIADALVARCRANEHHVDLALIDASCLHAGVPPGNLTFGDWFKVMPYADTIRMGWLSGRQLKLLLEDNACRVNRPGEPNTDRGFVHFSRQVRYHLYLNKNRWEATATNITFENVPLDHLLDRKFLVACSSHFRAGAATWESQAVMRQEIVARNQDWPKIETNLFLRDELVTYIRANGGITADAGARRDGRVLIVWPESLAQTNNPGQAL